MKPGRFTADPTWNASLLAVRPANDFGILQGGPPDHQPSVTSSSSVTAALP